MLAHRSRRRRGSACRRDARTPIVLYSPARAGPARPGREGVRGGIRKSTCGGSTWARRRSTTACARRRRTRRPTSGTAGPTRSSRAERATGCSRLPAGLGGRDRRRQAAQAGDLYFGLYRTPAMPVYNSGAVAAADAPREWDDLLDPRWKGKILIRDPLASGTMRAVWGWSSRAFGRARPARPTAASHGSRAWTPRRRSTSSTPRSSVEKVARREGLVTIWDLPDILLERQRGSPSPVRLSLERHARHRRRRGGRRDRRWS